MWNEQSATFKKAELFCSAFWLERRIIMPDLNNNLLNYSDFNILAFDAIKAQTKIMQGFGVDLRKQVVDIEN